MLFERFKVPCTRMERRCTPDGEGGRQTFWADGKGFGAALVLMSGNRARIAEAEGFTALYTVTADKGTGLSFHDVFRRDSDGQAFRVTRVLDPTPGEAGFAFDQYQAEEWEAEDE